MQYCIVLNDTSDFFYCNVSGSFTDGMNIQYFQFLDTVQF